MELPLMEDASPEERAYWEPISRETTASMRDHCLPFTTPISREISATEGELAGSGSYLEYRGRRLLVTNEHVVRAWQAHRFAHQFNGSADVLAIAPPLGMDAFPVDAAVCEVSETVWRHAPHRALALAESRLATRHAPVPGELLFVCGYPRARSVCLFGTLFSSATPLLTQEYAPPPIDDVPPNEFVMPHSPGRTQSVEPGTQELTYPGGMSGSLVWNTRRIECLRQGREWSPEFADITGLLCRWDDKIPALFVLRVEILREFLNLHVSTP